VPPNISSPLWGEGKGEGDLLYISSPLGERVRVRGMR